MTEFLYELGNYKEKQYNFSSRKLRLFAVAYCYRIWSQIEKELDRQAVIFLERYADGTANFTDFRKAMGMAERNPSYWLMSPWKRSEFESEVEAKMRLNELKAQADFLRDLYNPWSTALDLAVQRWNEHIVKLASAIYNDNSFDQMPILADALEESGFTDATVLMHLRGPTSHVRGCWALDDILGKS